MLESTVRLSRSFPIFTVFLLLAGCTGPAGDDGEGGGRFEAAGRGRPSWVAPGMSYDGVGARHVFCVILIQSDAATDTGQVRFDLDPEEMDGRKWDVVMDRFFGTEEWKQGGIRQDFDAHGDTGTGDASLPKVHVEQAGWGEVRVAINDETLKDPVTGEGTWLARYEVLTTGVRDDASGSIRSGNKTSAYHPSRPGDGFADPNDSEIHFTMRAHKPPPQAPNPIDIQTEPIRSPPAYNQSFPLIADNPYFGTHLAFNITMATFVGTSGVIFRVLDPQGAELWSNTADQQGEVFPVSLVVEKLGAYTLQVSGSPVLADFEAVGAWIPPKEVLLNFWWEDVIYDEAAVFEYENKRHEHGGTH